MKKSATILLAFSVLATTAYFFSSKEKESNTEEQVFSKKYEQWLYDRYKDPATGKIPANIKQNELEFIKKMKLKFNSNNKRNHTQSLNDWTSRGPYFMGGRTRAVVLDVNDENRILAGGVDAGMWLSTDGGSNWKKTTLSTQLPSVTTIDQDKREGKQNIWYHGTGERIGNRMNGNGIYKSTDNGESWNRLESTINGNVSSWDNPFDFVYRIRTNPNAPLNKDEVYAATSIGGIYRSEDGGTTWEPVLGGGVSNSLSLYTDLEITSEGVFYATMSSMGTGSNESLVKGIFRSTNGVDWVNITPSNFPENYNRIVIGIDPQNENSVYFLAVTPEFGIQTTNSQGHELWHSLFHYEYESGNGAGENGTWTELTDNLPNPELIRHQINTQTGYDMLVKVHPDNPNIIYIGGVNLYRSNTGWTTPEFKVVGGTCPTDDCDYHYRYPNHHADQHNMIFLPSDPYVSFTATDGGIHKTLDNNAESTEWISLNNGYLTTQYYGLSIDHATESGDLIGGLQDNGTIYTSEYDSQTIWSDVLRGDGFQCIVADSSKFFITSKNSSYEPDINLYKTTISKEGKLLKGARIDPIGGKDFIWNTPFVLDPNDNNIMYLAGGRTVWRNSDLSEIEMFDFPETGWMNVKNPDSISTNWVEFSESNVIRNDTNERITAIAVSKNPANTVFYGTNNGKLYRIDNANSGNPTPIDVTGSEFQLNSTISSIDMDSENSDEVIVALSNYGIKSVFHSLDKGNSWTQVGGNLEENANGSGSGPAVNFVKIVKYDGKKSYMAGTSIGLFVTSFLNGLGTVWEQEAENTIGYNNVFTLDTRELDGYTVAGTYATGAYATYFRNEASIPSKTTLKSPENNEINISRQPKFQWNSNPDAYFYHLQVATDENFSNIIYNESNISETEKEVFGIVDLGFKNYYWRVATINAGGESEFTDTWTFQTGVGAPDLLLPENGAKNQPLTVNVKWDGFKLDAISYRVQLGDNTFFTKIADEGATLDDNYTFDNLEKGRRYFWRVKAYFGGDSSEYGEKYSFETEPASSVESEAITKSVILYPNPASHFTTIDLNSLEKLPKSIKLFDSQGKQIRKINYSNQKTIVVDLKNLESGQYFLRLEFDKFKISKRFIKI